MGAEMQLGPGYLRLQSNRCHRLSQTCMDLSTARDLRLMAEEYFGEAAKMEITARDSKTSVGPRASEAGKYGILNRNGWPGR